MHHLRTEEHIWEHWEPMINDLPDDRSSSFQIIVFKPFTSHFHKTKSFSEPLTKDIPSLRQVLLHLFRVAFMEGMLDGQHKRVDIPAHAHEVQEADLY